MATIRTMNFDKMEIFYREKLQLRQVQGDFVRYLWLQDFKTEIHVEEVKDQDDVGVDGTLILYASNVKSVARGFGKRGLSVELRERQSATEAFLRDPDENILMIRAEDENT